MTHVRPAGPVAAVVVTHDSSAVIERCLRGVLAAAPRRGVAVRVVDNASNDDTVARATAIVGADCIVSSGANRGFAAGVNAGIASVEAPWIAVINPDAVVPAGALDRLADVLDADERAALVGPRVHDAAGRSEPTAGLFPTLERERAHTWMLDRLLGLEGRRAKFPRHTAPVDWVSGCAWLLRADAANEVGPLDEAYFMYYEDVDYCHRLHDAGWRVLATPDVSVVHEVGGGSSETPRVPADGGTALLHYFSKFHPDAPMDRLRALLVRGWRLRRAWRMLRVRFGDRGSLAPAERYRLALESLERS